MRFAAADRPIEFHHARFESASTPTRAGVNHETFDQENRHHIGRVGDHRHSAAPQFLPFDEEAVTFRATHVTRGSCDTRRLPRLHQHGRNRGAGSADRRGCPGRWTAPNAAHCGAGRTRAVALREYRLGVSGCQWEGIGDDACWRTPLHRQLVAHVGLFLQNQDRPQQFTPNRRPVARSHSLWPSPVFVFISNQDFSN